MHFYTSINNNYLAKARVLAKSIKQHNSQAKFSLILADRVLDDLDLTEEPFDEILTLEQLGFTHENLNFWTYSHTVVELCTAIKGQALVKFLQEGAEKVVYLDPDIVVFDQLDELEQLLDRHDVVLTPHQCHPEDNRADIMNNEICSLKHGTYNFGFYAVHNTENGMKFAKWWRDRLVDFCYDDIPNGLFTDQKWGDLVPAFFDGVYIWRSPACNVSTWNLTNRNVAYQNGKYFVNGIPLLFYHFSGFDSGAQEVMLKLYGKSNDALFALREWYIEHQDLEGQQQMCKIPSIYDFYDNGEKIKKEERLLIRNRLDVYEYFKDVNPYVVEQEKSYYQWIQHEKATNGLFSDPVKKLELEKQEILNSKSWKITKPLREVKRFFGKK